MDCYTKNMVHEAQNEILSYIFTNDNTNYMNYYLKILYKYYIVTFNNIMLIPIRLNLK